MITLDADIYLLCSMFNISSKKLSNDYSGMSVEQIMEAEAAQGNTAAANFDSSILSDPAKLIELFKLDDTGNKFAILNNMNGHDLEEMLPLLQQDDLIMGLNYFTKDKLLNLIQVLPKEQLINYTLAMFPPEQLMQFMPQDQLNKVLQSTDLDKNTVLNFLPALKPEILAQMYEAATGQSIDNTGSSVGLDGNNSNLDKQTLLAQLSALPDDKFQEALLNIPPVNKQEFVLLLSNNNSKLLQSIDADAYTNIISSRKDKDEMIRYANVIDPDQLVKMDSQLPKELMSVILTQIDTSTFANILQKSFKNILSEIVAG